MTQVILGETEGIDSALRRFKRQVSKAGILPDLRKRDILKHLSKSGDAKLKLYAINAVGVIATNLVVKKLKFRIMNYE